MLFRFLLNQKQRPISYKAVYVSLINMIYLRNKIAVIKQTIMTSQGLFTVIHKRIARIENLAGTLQKIYKI